MKDQLNELIWRINVQAEKMNKKKAGEQRCIQTMIIDITSLMNFIITVSYAKTEAERDEYLKGFDRLLRK